MAFLYLDHALRAIDSMHLIAPATKVQVFQMTNQCALVMYKEHK